MVWFPIQMLSIPVLLLALWWLAVYLADRRLERRLKEHMEIYFPGRPLAFEVGRGLLRECGLKLAQLGPGNRLVEDLGLDRFDDQERLCRHLEGALGLRMEEDWIGDGKTLEDLVAMVERLNWDFHRPDKSGLGSRGGPNAPADR